MPGSLPPSNEKLRYEVNEGLKRMYVMEVVPLQEFEIADTMPDPREAI